MTRILSTDFAILSRFADRVRAIPGIQERTIPAAQALIAEAEKTIAELQGIGRSHQDALDLCNQVVNMVHDKPSPAERRRREREDRAEMWREIRAEAKYNW